MAEFYRDRNDATRIYDEEESKTVYNMIRCAGDLLDLDHNQNLTLFNKNEFVKYAQEHGEMNMIDLFKHFHFPIPQTEEEKEDPRFCLHLLYKKDFSGKLIPRENIYYCEKNIKDYRSPLKTNYSILEDDTSFDNKLIKPLNKEQNLGKMKKKIKLDKTIHNLRKTIGTKKLSNINDLSINDEKNVKLLKFNLCMKYYSKQLGFKELKKIQLNEISSLGQIYYIIKSAGNESETFNNPFKNYKINSLYGDFDENKDEENAYNFGDVSINNRKEEPKKSFIELLLKNYRIADNSFGYLSVKKGESQILFNNLLEMSDSLNESIKENKESDSQLLLKTFNRLQLASKNFKNKINSEKDSIDLYLSKINNNNELKFENFGNSLLYDDNRLVLILKGKRIDFTDKFGKKNRNHYYFRFYVENKLLNAVEVIFNQNVAKEELVKFKRIMNQVKINDEVVIAFAYNPTLYFNIRFMNYDFPPSGVESVFYIDSSIENQNVIKIFEEISI